MIQELQFQDFISKTVPIKSSLFSHISMNSSSPQSIQTNDSGYLLQPQNQAADPLFSPFFSDEAAHENKESLLTENSKRKFFTEKEDNLLAMAVMKYNQQSWNKIAALVPGRTPKQCRDRWVNYLQPSLNFGPWSEQEDQLLVTLVNSNGTHWTKMKSHFPDRSTSSLKNRWYWLLKNGVQTLPKNNMLNLSQNNVSAVQNPCQQLLNENNLANMMANNNITINDNNTDLNPRNFSQEENKQDNMHNYYYLMKRKTKMKNNGKMDMEKNFKPKYRENKKKTTNLNSNNININSIQNFIKNGDEELITFNQDELNW